MEDSIEKNKKLARRYFEELATQGQLNVAIEILDPTVVENAQMLLGTLKHAFPDFSIQVEDVIAEDDRVAVRFTATGTHLGDWHSPFGVFAPTGRAFSHEGIRIFQVRNGRLVQTWGSADELMRLAQLGIVNLASVPTKE